MLRYASGFPRTLAAPSECERAFSLKLPGSLGVWVPAGEVAGLLVIHAERTGAREHSALAVRRESELFTEDDLN